jgi:hypothetical protein
MVRRALLRLSAVVAAFLSVVPAGAAESFRLANQSQRVVLELPEGVAAERMVLSAPQSVELEIREASGVVSTLSDGRTVRFAGYGETLTLPAPRIVDAEGKSTTRARWEVGERTLRLSIDDEFLVYPIVIDLTATGPKAPRFVARTNAGGGTITGKLTDSYTGLGISKELVHLYNPQSEWVQSAISDATGAYVFPDVPAGTYYVAAVPSGYHAETYNNVACDTRPCTITGATPVNVVDLATTSNINFVLVSRSARVAGKVIESNTGTPLAGVAVAFFDGSGNRAGVGFTDQNGDYVADLGGTGIYYARTYNHVYPGIVDGRYSSTNCVDCSVTAGTAISATLGQVRTSVDFKLDPKGGSISGVLTDDSSLRPLRSKLVHVYNASGKPVTYAVSDEYGKYRTFHGLTSGKYYVAVTPPDYRGEVWDNVSCVADACNPLTGTGITVQLGLDTPNIDFGLTSNKAKVFGQIRDLAQRVKLIHVSVRFYDLDLNQVAEVFTDDEGFYEATLEPGSYFVKTAVSHTYRNFVDQLYPGIPCTACNIKEGRTITVKEGSVAEKLDFALSSVAGRISGVLYEAKSRLTIPYKHVELFDATGTFVKGINTDSRGGYVFDGLSTGEYYVVANPHGYLPQLYPGVECPDGQCDFLKGRSVGVKEGGTTTGVDFALYGNVSRIRGFVVDASTGAGIQAEVAFYTRLGEWAGSATTNSKGEYTATIADSGVFYARTFTATGNWMDQIYSGFECEGEKCDVTNGTPIEAQPDSDVTNVGFYLRSQSFRSLTLRSSSTNTSYGESVTFSATVDAPAPHGEFRFYSGTKLLGTKAAVDGSSTIAVADLPAGSHAITAEYVDDAGLEAASLRHSVDKAQRNIDLRASGNSLVTFTVRVNHAGEPAQVTFRSGNDVLATVTTEEDGTASLTVELPAGQYDVTATVDETPNFASGTSSVTHEVKKPSRRRGV